MQVVSGENTQRYSRFCYDHNENLVATVRTRDVNGPWSETKDQSMTYEVPDQSCIHKTMAQISDQRS